MGFQNKTGSITVTAKLTDVGKKYLIWHKKKNGI